MAPVQAVQLTVKALVVIFATLTDGIAVGAAATATVTVWVAVPAELFAVNVKLRVPTSFVAGV